MRKIPYGRQKISSEDIKAVVKVLKSDFLTQGPKIKEFEEKLAKYCGAKYAVAVSNGTAALHLTYLAANLKPGDEVITTPNTFVATSNMLLVIGARPVFCDIRLDNYNIDENRIESLITKRTKAIVPVHFAGQPCNMDKILKIAKKYKLTVIEDGAHALGANYKNKKVGNIGDMTTFSFHPVKSITTGEGGAILTNREDLYKKLVLLRSHGIEKDSDGKNVMFELGFNYRLTDIQAALGISQLKKLDSFIKSRNDLVKLYKKELSNIPQISLPTNSNDTKDILASWHIYVICTKRPEHRDPLANYLKSRGILVNFHYPAVYTHPYYKNCGYKNLELNNTTSYHNSCLTIPLHVNLQKKDIIYVSQQIKDYFYAKD